MTTHTRDIFSDDIFTPTPKQHRAPAAGAVSFNDGRELAGEQSARARDLWVAVLLTAVEDAAEPLDPHSASSKKRANQKAARRWLDHGGKDFRVVCSLAGFNPDAVRENWLSGKITRLAREATVLPEIAALEFIRENPGCLMMAIRRKLPQFPEGVLRTVLLGLEDRALVFRTRGRYPGNSITEAGIAYLQCAAGQPQGEAGILLGDGAGKQDGPLAGKFEGVR